MITPNQIQEKGDSREENKVQEVDRSRFGDLGSEISYSIFLVDPPQGLSLPF
jgi:hypothetical protein